MFIHDHFSMASLGVIEIVLLLLSAFYCAVLLGLTLGMGRLRYSPAPSLPMVSVIVAARNEEATIGGLVHHVLSQDYPAYEIIIANDRSTDRTKTIVQVFQARDPRIKLVDITASPTLLPPKKNALHQAIAASRGEILCFTDADCFPPPLWLRTLISAFDKDVGLVAGFSPYTSTARSPGFGKWLLNTFIRYEEFKGGTWSAGSIGLGMGWLCTGRSLAYRRRVFDEVGGFESIKQSISGDDDLFLQHVRRTTSWKIRYVTEPVSHVPTLPPPDFPAFVRQRTRHFSAGKFFPTSMKLFFFTFHTSNLLLYGSFIAAVVSGDSLSAYVPFLAKCVADCVLFFRSAPLLGQISFAPAFLIHEFFYVLYNAFIGPLSFISKIQWKPEDMR
jgi:cellulose synthase/poly-beta-1,6-N-acetylglucosamine synthase-like glycosyltransferase